MVKNLDYVNMGERFWADYYEPQWLSEQLRTWWNEPQLIEQVGKRQRVRLLRQWVLEREKSGARWVGAKHPFPCFCGEDLTTEIQVVFGKITNLNVLTMDGSLEIRNDCG